MYVGMGEAKRCGIITAIQKMNLQNGCQELKKCRGVPRFMATLTIITMVMRLRTAWVIRFILILKSGLYCMIVVIGEELSERGDFASISVGLCLRCRRMRREVFLMVSKGRCGSSASIRGEGKRNIVRIHY